MSYSASVNPDLCLSSGNCIRRAPEAFAWSDDDTAVARPAGVSALSDDMLVQIARGCPVGAIRLHTLDGAEVDPYASV